MEGSESLSSPSRSLGSCSELNAVTAWNAHQTAQTESRRDSRSWKEPSITRIETSTPTTIARTTSDVQTEYLAHSIAQTELSLLNPSYVLPANNDLSQSTNQWVDPYQHQGRNNLRASTCDGPLPPVLPVGNNQRELSFEDEQLIASSPAYPTFIPPPSSAENGSMQKCEQVQNGSYVIGRNLCFGAIPMPDMSGNVDEFGYTTGSFRI